MDPRESDSESQTGTGVPRSSEGTVRTPSMESGETSSHPADADGLNVNRSGSGGTGGPATEDSSEGSAPADLDELLGGDSAEGSNR